MTDNKNIVGKRVKILRGLQKGGMGEVIYQTESHPLSSEKRFYVYLFNRKSFWGKNYILINESGLQVLEE